MDLIGEDGENGGEGQNGGDGGGDAQGQKAVANSAFGIPLACRTGSGFGGVGGNGGPAVPEGKVAHLRLRSNHRRKTSKYCIHLVAARVDLGEIRASLARGDWGARVVLATRSVRDECPSEEVAMAPEGRREAMVLPEQTAVTEQRLYYPPILQRGLGHRHEKDQLPSDTLQYLNRVPVHLHHNIRYWTHPSAMDSPLTW